MEILSKTYVQYKCNCNLEKIEQVLISLGEEELTKIIEEDEKAEVVCHFVILSIGFKG